MKILHSAALGAGLWALAACGGGDDGGGGTADPGAAAFRQCAICHATAPRGTPRGDMRLIGPNLHGVVGAPAARLSDYDYSRALGASGLVWDEATLDAFIENPQKIVPGTRMSFAGERDAERRRAIIDYLKGGEE